MRTDDLIRSLAADLRRVQPLRAVEQRTMLWAAFSLLSVLLGTLARGTRPDLASKLRDPVYLVETALLLATFLLAGRSAFQLSVPGAERSARGRVLSIVGFLLWGAVVASDASAPSPPSLNGASCIPTILGLALVPGLTVLLLLRKAAPLRPGWTAGVALLSAASLAVLASVLVCAREDRLHLLLWHFAPVVLVVVIGSGLGRRLLRRAPIALPWPGESRRTKAGPSLERDGSSLWIARRR
ncbi:MAG TPA: DUF1109 domain-containing protein [Myxococcales bacterium]|nr:DUF1109 domain-containing protein [Myxococcales bacterium]